MKIKVVLFVLLIIVFACTNKSSKVTTVNAEKNTETVVDSVLPAINKAGESEKSENSKKETVEEKENISVISASSQGWVAGISSGGSGTEYYFNTVINTGRKLVFDTAWIENRAFGLFVSKNSKSISSKPITYSKGDTITLRISDLKNSRTQNQSKAPVKFEGAALIRFTSDGEKKYYTIKEIKRLDPVNRPQNQ